jgi:3-oxoacyl-[acyl-carrier protein] reductase
MAPSLNSQWMAARGFPGATSAGCSQSRCVVTPPTGYAVAIVTGGSCGPGREFALTLASRGYALSLVYLGDQAGAEAAVADILAANGTAVAIRADVGDEVDVERLFDETTAAFGGVDVVVHATVRGTSLVYQQAARQLRDGGAIINVSSPDAIAPALADALRARDITVNGVAPGLECPGAEHDVGDLVSFLDRWRSGPGE